MIPEPRADILGRRPIEWVATAHGISAGYGDHLVLHDITAGIPRGAITCIIGGSGCGKSTDGVILDRHVQPLLAGTAFRRWLKYHCCRMPSR